MSELAKLGAIIDELFKKQRKGMELDRCLVFIVGNGIEDVCNILNDKKLRRKAGRRYRSPAEFEDYKWRHFEYARYYTSTSLPSLAHCCIYKLIEFGLCRDVITTNYDMFFDTIWQNFASSSIQQNPVLDFGEFGWEGYYTSKYKARAKPRYWKIHGSLSHVCFQTLAGDGQHHLHRLPRFAISSNNDLLAKSFGIPTQAPHMGFEAQRYPKTRFAHPVELKASFKPFIDWTYSNDRGRFKREIEGAKAVLISPKKIAALILIGFSGYYNDSDVNDPWNEELVPEIRRLKNSGFSNIFMSVHNEQYKRIDRPPYSLMREMGDENRCWTYDVSGDFMLELVTSSLLKNSQKV